MKRKYNYNKLKGRIVEIYGTQKAFSNAVGLSRQAVSNKLNNIVNFSQDEIMKSTEILNIPTSQISEYFFSEQA